jgi:hypothetical protein
VIVDRVTRRVRLALLTADRPLLELNAIVEFRTMTFVTAPNEMEATPSLPFFALTLSLKETFVAAETALTTSPSATLFRTYLKIADRARSAINVG